MKGRGPIVEVARPHVASFVKGAAAAAYGRRPHDQAVPLRRSLSRASPHCRAKHHLVLPLLVLSRDGVVALRLVGWDSLGPPIGPAGRRDAVPECPWAVGCASNRMTAATT